MDSSLLDGFLQAHGPAHSQNDIRPSQDGGQGQGADGKPICFDFTKVGPCVAHDLALHILRAEAEGRAGPARCSGTSLLCMQCMVNMHVHSNSSAQLQSMLQPTNKGRDGVGFLTCELWCNFAFL